MNVEQTLEAWEGKYWVKKQVVLNMSDWVSQIC